MLALQKDSFKGKVVWVSGASCGLGEAIALQFAEAGAKLVITGNEDTHDQVKSRCIEASKGKLKDADVLALPPFDIRDVDQHRAIIDKVLAHFKKVRKTKLSKRIEFRYKYLFLFPVRLTYLSTMWALHKELTLIRYHITLKRTLWTLIAWVKLISPKKLSDISRRLNRGS